MSARIRLASPADASDIHAIYRPIARDTHISFEYTVPDSAEIARRIMQTLRQYPWLICQIGGRTAGYAYASAFRSRQAYRWTTETTVYVHSAFQRRGVSRAIYHSLLAILRAQGYLNAVGVISLPNPASVRAHESLGFRPIGVIRKAGYKADSWHDTGWWQYELGAPSESPQPPLAITDLAPTEQFDALLATGLPHIKS